ncbi:hypothetical protein D3C79_550940 [compost metagenome]
MGVARCDHFPLHPGAFSLRQVRQRQPQSRHPPSPRRDLCETVTQQRYQGQRGQGFQALRPLGDPGLVQAQSLQPRQAAQLRRPPQRVAGEVKVLQAGQTLPLAHGVGVEGDLVVDQH